MKITWLHRHRRSHLLIFCNGWGMDETPFIPLQARSLDVLMCYDYKDLSCESDLFSLMREYPQVSLLGWSMGVWAGQHLFSSKAKEFRRTIAVNGTLCPIHDRYGIAPNLFAETHVKLDELTRQKFYYRMCKTPQVLERFLAHQPKREISDQKEELACLLDKTDCMPVSASIYSDVVIATRDYIVPTDNQRRFWGEKELHLFDGTHFPFYSWTSWDAILHDPGKGDVAQPGRE